MIDIYISAQQSIVGCLLIDCKQCGCEIFASVTEEHFTIAELRTLFSKCKELYFSGENVDKLIVAAQANNAYYKLILDIVETTPSAANYHTYIEIIAREYRIAQLSTVSNQLHDSVVIRDCDGARSAAESAISIIDGASKSDSSVGLLAAMGEFFDELDKTPKYIKYGIKGLDERTYTELGDYVVIGARPSVGKTALALNIAGTMAREYKTIFFSLETSVNKLTARYAANALDVDFSKIKNRTMSLAEKETMVQGLQSLKDSKLRFQAAAGMSVSQICGMALRERAQVVIVDYIGLVSEPSSKSDYERVTAISKYFHTFAQKHKILVIVLSQFSRESTKSHKPSMAHLRESGQLEQDADAIFLLHKPSDEHNARELIIEKNKEGIVGSVMLDFDGSRQRFFESPQVYDIMKKIKSAVRAANGTRPSEAWEQEIFGTAVQ